MYWFVYVKCMCFVVILLRIKYELFYNVSLIIIFKVVFICFVEMIKGKFDCRLFWFIDEKYIVYKFFFIIVLLNRFGCVIIGSVLLLCKSDDCVCEMDFW